MADKTLLRNGLSLLVMLGYVLAIWWLTLPEWKRRTVLMWLARMAARGKTQATGPHLDGAQELAVREFRNLVTKWDHEQL